MAAPRVIHDILPSMTQKQLAVRQQDFSSSDQFITAEYEAQELISVQEWTKFELFLHVMVLLLSIGIVVLSALLIWRLYLS